MSLWVHWSVGVVHCWLVGVVHTLLISLICWVKHKLVYASVSILWLLMLVWGVLLYLVTVSCGLVFLSWVVFDCVLLKSLSGVLLCPSWVLSCCLLVRCEGLVSQSESFALSLCSTLVLSLFESVNVIVSLSVRSDSLWQWAESSLGVLSYSLVLIIPRW